MAIGDAALQQDRKDPEEQDATGQDSDVPLRRRVERIEGQWHRDAKDGAEHVRDQEHPHPMDVALANTVDGRKEEADGVMRGTTQLVRNGAFVDDHVQVPPGKGRIAN